MDPEAEVTCLEVAEPPEKSIRQGRLISLLLFLLPGICAVHAQEQTPAQPAGSSLAPAQRTWAIEASMLTFLYPDTLTLWNPVLNARHGHLHLEARYQWEDWRTASVWAGRHFVFGTTVKVEVTPMVGAVFGHLNGMAPGYLLEAHWRSLSFYSSSELFISFRDGTDNFAYTWNELGVDLKVISAGIAAQRLRAVRSPLDLERGVWLKREQGDFIFGAYLFNFGWTDPTVAVSLAYGFGAGTLQRQMPAAKPALGTRE